MIKLACASLSFDGFGDTNFVKTFEQAPTVGYEYVEFNCWYPSTLTPQKMRDLRERCAEKGLKPAALHTGSYGGVGREELTKDACHKIQAMRCALDLGCNMVVSSGYGRDEAGGLDAVISTLKEVVPAAEELGVILSLENHESNTIENIDDYRRIIDAVPSKNVGICIDTGHFDAASVDMMALIDELGDHVNHIHLKENQGMGKKHFVRFGEGTTDNHAIVKKMISRGYNGFLTIELSPEIGEHDGRPFTMKELITPFEMFSPYCN